MSWRSSSVKGMAAPKLQTLPYVRTAMEINEMKFWRKSDVRENVGIADPIKRAKNWTARSINFQLSKLSEISRKTSMAFPALQKLHPFEREVVLLTLGAGTYELHVQNLRKVYATLHQIGKRREQECQQVRTKQEAIDVLAVCTEELQQAVQQHAETLQQAADMAKTLRNLPCIDLDKAIFAFVGAPNVGKSSLVRALSTASPDVANYPFTTRAITMGHIFVDGVSYQIADTPGLIFRPDDKRNAIEKLALAILDKTRASIGFVIDASESAGTSIQDQLSLRQELLHRVASTRSENPPEWIDIVSKLDLPNAKEAFQQMQQQNRLAGKFPPFPVSTATNENLVRVGDTIKQVLTRS